MTSDYEAREAAAKALGPELADTYDCTRVWEAWGYETMSQDDFEPAGLRCEEIANAAIDAYNAKLREGMDDVRRVVGMVLAERLDDSLTTDEQFDAIADEITLLLAQHQDHTELIRKPSREQLIDLLRSAEHAPISTHDPRDGSCRECPWPVHMLPPEDIADAVIALLEGKNDE